MIRVLERPPVDVQRAATETVLAYLAAAGEPSTAGWDGRDFVLDGRPDPRVLDVARRVACEAHGIPYEEVQ